MISKSVICANASEKKRALLVNFDNVFHNSTEHLAFSALNAFQEKRFTMSNGLSGKVLSPDEFKEMRDKSESGANGSSKLQSFIGLSPLAGSTSDFFSLMLEIDKKPLLAASAASGKKLPLLAMKLRLALSTLANRLKAEKYLGQPSLSEKQLFAESFNGYLTGEKYTSEGSTDIETPFGTMPLFGIMMDQETYAPLMSLNQPIAGAYRHLSILLDQASLYFSTHGSRTFAGMIESTWGVWIMLVTKSGAGFEEAQKSGILDVQINGPFRLNIPSDLRLVQGESPLSDRLFSGKKEIFGIEEGGTLEHLRLVSESEGLPFKDIWLLEGNYNRQAFRELRKSGFENIVVVENNPSWSWNYDEARHDGIPVLGMENLASHLAALMGSVRP